MHEEKDENEHGHGKKHEDEHGHKVLIEVKANFLSDRGHTRMFDASDFDSIVVVLGDGNDKAKIDKRIDKPVLIHGGVGNDDLRAGGGPTELIGGAGNDRLRGDGDDVLDGGLSNDRLDGDEGNDHLMGGMKGR